MEDNPSALPRTRPPRPGGNSGNSSSGGARTLMMSPLPGTNGTSTRDWGAAVGNLEDAKLAMEALKTLMNDAVFLDEEAFSLAGNVSAHTQTIKAQQRRLRELDNECAALRAEVESKDRSVVAAGQQLQVAQKKVGELEETMDLNAAVFNLHFQELLDRNAEIVVLKATIDSLQPAQQVTEAQY